MVPPCMLRWFRHFLADRRARVKWENQLSREVCLREGLPQGAVTSPLLWLCYMNDLAPMLRRHGVEVAMYADDLVMYSRDRDVDSATSRVQAGLDELEEWAETWNMEVSKAKTQSILFSSHQAEVNGKRRINLCLGDQVLEQVTDVKILGVIFDTQLTFRAHIMKTKQKVEKRIGAMKALAGTRWGCREQTLRKLYKTFIQPVALYGSSTFMNFARPTNREELDKTAAAAARVITGCPVDTRKAVLMAEAELRPITLLAEEQAAVLREKILRLPEDTPAQSTANREIPGRLKGRDTWRETARNISSMAGLDNLPRESQALASQPPWATHWKGKLTFCTSAASTASREDPPEIRKLAYMKATEDLPNAQTTYFTDGSTARGFGAGGSGIYRSEPSGRGERKWCVPAGSFTSSFRSEQVALAEALNDSNDTPPNINCIRICTDSLSLLQKLQGPPWQTQTTTLAKIREKLTNQVRKGKEIQLVWVPGHAGVVENETADHAANTGREQQEQARQDNLPVDLMSAKTAIKHACSKKWSGVYHTTVPPEHLHRRATQGQPPKQVRAGQGGASGLPPAEGKSLPAPAGHSAEVETPRS